MNIAIVDDIEEERILLDTILSEYARSRHLDLNLYSFADSESLLAEYRPLKYAIVFLDIFMDGISGIKAAEEIRKKDSDTLIVFQTASGDHMPDAFAIHAYDYVQKPFEPERIFRVMDDSLRRITTHEVPSLVFSMDRERCSLPYSDIMAIRSEAHYLEITDFLGKHYRTRMTFTAVSELLAGDSRFLQILRGILVNMDYIQSFSGGSCRLEGDLYLPVNIRRSKEIEGIWHNYQLSRLRNEPLQKSVGSVRRTAADPDGSSR